MGGLIDHGIKGYQDPAVKGFQKTAKGEFSRNMMERDIDAKDDALQAQSVMAGAGMGMFYGMSEAGAAFGGPAGAAIGAGLGLLIDGLF